MAQDKLESRLQSLRLERQVTCPKPLREEVDTEKRLKNPGDTDPFVSHFVSSTGFSTKDQEEMPWTTETKAHTRGKSEARN